MYTLPYKTIETLNLKKSQKSTYESFMHNTIFYESKSIPNLYLTGYNVENSEPLEHEDLYCAFIIVGKWRQAILLSCTHLSVITRELFEIEMNEYINELKNKS